MNARNTYNRIKFEVIIIINLFTHKKADYKKAIYAKI
jgi:hypothetical protein